MLKARLFQVLGIFLIVTFGIGVLRCLEEGEFGGAVVGAAITYGSIVLYLKGEKGLERAERARRINGAITDQGVSSVDSIKSFLGLNDLGQAMDEINDLIQARQIKGYRLDREGRLITRVDISAPVPVVSHPERSFQVIFTCKLYSAKNNVLIAPDGNAKCEFCDAPYNL